MAGLLLTVAMLGACTLQPLPAGSLADAGQLPRPDEAQLPTIIGSDLLRVATGIDPRDGQLVRAVVDSGNFSLITGNRVELLIDGPQTFSAMAKAIAGAEHHIHLETYIFADDRLGSLLSELLIQRALEGVVVRVIYDAFGSMDTDDAFFEEMREHGIQVVAYRPLNLKNFLPWRINNRDHRKLLIVDGRISFTGGINIMEAYTSSSFSLSKPDREGRMEDGWRDTQVRIEGPVTAFFQQYFLETWYRSSENPVGEEELLYPELAAVGSELVGAVASRGDARESNIYTTYLAAIDNARENIYLTNAYFVPNSTLKEKLKTAAERGVDVKLLVPGFTDSSLAIAASRATYETLLESGVRIFEQEDTLLHAKTATVDGVVSIVGSANLDMRSFLHNNEITAVVVGSSFAEQNEEAFHTDLQNSLEITLESWRRRPMMARFREMFGRLFSYWL